MLARALRSALVAVAAAPLPPVRGAERLRAVTLRGLSSALLAGRPLGAVLSALDPGAVPSAQDTRVAAALRRWPTTCLARSLAGYASLRAAGVEVRFVVGVRMVGGEIVAHAWLERCGAPVGEPADPRATYAVAFTHPRTAREEDGPVIPSTHPRPSPDVILTELADGTGVLLHLETKFYYALNRTGVFVWKALAGGQPAAAEPLAQAVSAAFQGAAPAQARADVEALLRELLDEGLVLPAAAG